MFHQVNVIEAVDDDRQYAGYGTRLLGPFEDRFKAAAAINRAAAAVAIRYAGMDVTPDQALDETFGTGDDDERQRLADMYYLTFYNLLDGTENTILDQMAEDDDALQWCEHWCCSVCDDRWSGPSSDCWNCECAAKLAEETEDEDDEGDEEKDDQDHEHATR